MGHCYIAKAEIIGVSFFRSVSKCVDRRGTCPKFSKLFRLKTEDLEFIGNFYSWFTIFSFFVEMKNYCNSFSFAILHSPLIQSPLQTCSRFFRVPDGQIIHVYICC